jgi:riboflavin kinase/FMN adenylyltransferase
MQVYFGLDQLPQYYQGVVLTLGVFDGLHLGHLEIVRRVVKKARQKKVSAVLITFEPHPRIVLSKDSQVHLPILTTPEEKIALLQDSGLDVLLFLQTTDTLLKMTAADFIQRIVVDHYHPSELIVGYDFHFGRERGGNAELLRAEGLRHKFLTQVVPAQKLGNQVISSSEIRSRLAAGDLTSAIRFLGHAYSLSGTVKKGAGRGRQLGFPTANLAISSPSKLIPASGVYLVKAFLDEAHHFGICNIGNRITFDESDLEIEVYLLKYPGQELYERKLKLYLLEWLRPEFKFKTVKELQKQMLKDKEIALFKIEQEYTKMEDKLNVCN